MLERLLGKFEKMIRFGGLAELVREVSGGGGVLRFVIYPEGSETVIVAHVLPDGRVRAVGYREGEGLVRPDLSLLLRGGYAEVFTETAEQVRMDEEIIRGVAAAEGVGVEDVIVETSLAEMGAVGGAEEGREGGGCVLGLAEIVERFGGRYVVDDRLSKLLSYPSTTGRILLAAELDAYDAIGCEEVKELIMRNFEGHDAVALRFTTGPYTAWVVKCGERVGIALFERSRVRLAGTKVVDKLEKVERFIARAIKEYGRATVMVYLVPKKLVMECQHLLRSTGP